jgi:N-acetylglucosaminyldiphosphoundecaprenol N-acetyl-beta-D-mannosaminyltransferase
MKQQFTRILGIDFFTGDTSELLSLCAEGRFIVAPAAPALAELPTDPIYRESVEKSDFAITDSAFMVILWKLLTGRSMPRISGVKLLQSLLASDELRTRESSVWIMPSRGEMEINLAWLNKNGISLTAEECCIAPHYPKGTAICDPDLLVWIEARKPRYIIINIGGGIQEPLGLYLKDNLCYRPSIICVGAAIAFLSGIQAKIPPWADKCMLGWLCRCLDSPKRFIPRYWGALRLVAILAKYGERSLATYAPDSEASCHRPT